VFDPNRIDVRAKLGTTEQWTLINTTPSDHPFHIHVDNFQIMSINGVPYHTHNVQDTGIIPKHARIVIRIAFDDFVGKFVFHCHVLGHEDLGMMKTVEVYKDRGHREPSLRARSAIGLDRRTSSVDRWRRHKLGSRRASPAQT
jgi:hypothetical protein